MRFLAVANILAICGFTLATTTYHNPQDKGQATSYSFVTQHGGFAKQQDHYSQGNDWEKKKWSTPVTRHNGYQSDHYDYTPQYKPYNDNKQAEYMFEYGVKDLETGDIKNQWERREGDQVKGGYSLKEADGTIRIVEYTADGNGFNAVVKKIGQAEHPKVDSKPQHIVLKEDYDHDIQPHYYVYKQAKDQHHDHTYDQSHDLTYGHTNDHSYEHSSNYTHDHTKDQSYDHNQKYSYKQDHVNSYDHANNYDHDHSYANDYKQSPIYAILKQH